MGSRNTVVATTKAEPFTLDLPEVLASIAPLWSIPLPRKHTAHIYNYSVRTSAFTDGKQTDTLVPGYRVVVANSRGEIRRGYSDDAFTADDRGHLKMRLFLEALAAEMTPKTRSRREIDEYEDD